MKRNILLKFGAPILALSLVAACGTDDGMDPGDEDAPLDQEDNGGMEEDGGMDDNGGMEENGGMEDNGDENNGNGTGVNDTNNLEEPNDNLYDDEGQPGGQGNQ